MFWCEEDLVAFIQSEFRRLADPAKAGPMAAYMKTEMPFYGIQKPERIPVYREMKKRFVPTTRPQMEGAVRALWALEHREEKYAAIEYAKQNKRFYGTAAMPLYKFLLQEGAWWDFVDDIAVNLISDSYLMERAEMAPVIEEWIDDADMWVRRAALLSHNHHKDQTNWQQLSDHCLRRAHEKEFFIRKAIGWALREYSHSDPSAVEKFLTDHRDRLSPLSFKEGGKALARTGIMTP